ncbi:MAG: M48 family metalloprotease [Calditrichia bacterium]
MGALKKWRIKAGIVLVAFLISCATNPVTGKKELMLLSKEDEIQMGEQTDEQVIQTYGIYNDADLGRFVSELGQKMAKLSHRPNLPYEFKVMDTPVINAFAVPGGYVYMTRGIMVYLNNEAALAGVMGHEIGHIAAKHTAQQYSRAQLANLGLGLGMILSEDFRQFAGLAQFGVQMLFLKFSRDDESQSDKLGVEYAVKAGYDASEMAGFFRTLERMNEASGSTLPTWFSTHPDPGDRYNRIIELAQKWKKKVPQENFQVDRDGYLARLDNMIYGEDPRQGYVENNVFYHPEMKFKFPVPSGWQVQNSASQVQMASPDQDAVILFTLTPAANPAEAANKFLSDSQANLVSQDATTVNGFPTQRLVSVLETQQGQLQVMSYFIQKDNTVFVFHGFTSPDAFSGYQSAFQSTMNQFSRLTDGSKINVQPNWIHIRNAPRSANLGEILMALNMPNDKLDELSLLNGMELSDNVPANTKIKTVEWNRQ